MDGPISHYDIYEDRKGNLWAQRKRGHFGSGAEGATYLGKTADFEAPDPSQGGGGRSGGRGGGRRR